MRRLTFIAEGTRIELAYDQMVDMIEPGSVAADVGPQPDANAMIAAMSGVSPGDGPPQFWYEMRDRNGTVLARKAAPDPIAPDIEVFSEDDSGSITRMANPSERRVFNVLLPEIDDATEVRLVRAPAQRSPGESMGIAAADIPSTATEVATFELA